VPDSRPAIDPLFQSAAVAYGPRVVGVVLSGTLDDGTAGLQVIKQRGGIALVQDPQEALFPSMPQSAIAHVPVDNILPVAAIGPALVELATTPVQQGVAAMSDGNARVREPLESLSAYTCPECHGTLWEVQQGTALDFCCRVGHRFSVESLVARESEQVETALWTAVRVLEEKAALLCRLADRAEERVQGWADARFAVDAQELERKARVVREVLFDPGMPGTEADQDGAAEARGEQGAL
jgi:two-component system chemotaxis response regulator CheB